jgi:ferredoxin-nitrite reductase
MRRGRVLGLIMTSNPNDEAFSPAQKEYLSGFLEGMRQFAPFVGARADGKLSATQGDAPANEAAEPAFFGVPIDDLAREERFKYEQNPLDIWDKLLAHAAADTFPDAAAGDVYRFKFFGLFHVAPAQDSFMLRCRIPACAMRADQLAGLAQMARDWGNGHIDVTTRGNLQLREFKPRDIVSVLLRLDELGLTSRGSGADNVRNITASPTSGFDTQELIDVRPFAHALHHYILNSRDLYGLPRKFNVAFDSGGAISVCADTNDLAFYAVRVAGQPDIADGVYFRVELGGITGHGDFSRDCGLLIDPSESVAVAAAMLRVFNTHGCRTDRKKARLKYLLEDWGVQKYLDETQKLLAFPLRFVPLERSVARPAAIRHSHIGFHAQRQAGARYVGVAMPVGRISAAQAEGLAEIARAHGSGDVRLTVWQNVLIPDIPLERVEAVKAALLALDLHYDASSVRAGLVACTGNKGCKYAATDTKGHARAIAGYLEPRLELDQPINIHLTGCPHSCAQHYIGDIGLLGAQVTDAPDGEGYQIYVGGGEGAGQGIARQVYGALPFAAVPLTIERMLRTYLEHRNGDESFLAFTRRHDVDALRALFGEAVRA